MPLTTFCTARSSGQITIGRPIRPERYADRGAEHLQWRSMIDEVMFEIRELTGQTYVHRYHGEQAETEPTVAARIGNVSDIAGASARNDPPAADEREFVIAGGA